MDIWATNVAVRAEAFHDRSFGRAPVHDCGRYKFAFARFESSHEHQPGLRKQRIRDIRLSASEQRKVPQPKIPRTSHGIGPLSSERAAATSQKNRHPERGILGPLTSRSLRNHSSIRAVSQVLFSPNRSSMKSMISGLSTPMARCRLKGFGSRSAASRSVFSRCSATANSRIERWPKEILASSFVD